MYTRQFSLILPFLLLSATSSTFTGLSSLATGTINPPVATAVYIKDRLIFKAQLPPDHKHQMTEIALYPAISNQLAMGRDSRVLASFGITEPWSIFGGTGTVPYDAAAITDVGGNIVPFAAKFLDIDNISFRGSATRTARYETPRFLDRCLMLAGNTTTFSNDSLDTVSSGTHVDNSSFSADLSKYPSSDIIKFAVSIVSKDEVVSETPYKTRIRIDLIDIDNKVASFKKLVYAADIAASRYIILEETLGNLYTPDTTFNWSKIISMNIYVQTMNASNVYDDSYVIFDGMRIEESNNVNPLYGMVAYSKLKNSTEDGLPIEKIENSQGYIEYRLGVSIF